MMWIEAEQIGQACGLATGAEIIANIHIHALNFFVYTKMAAELKELREDAIANGIDYDKLLAEANRNFMDKVNKAERR